MAQRQQWFWRLPLVALVGCLGAWGLGAFGAEIPVGERKYILDGDNPFAPVEIRSTMEASSKNYLRDPNLKDLGKLAKPLGKANGQPKKFVKKKKSHPRAIVFQALEVAGDRSGPRVRFVRDELPLGRSDEPLTSDFFDKVYQPLADDDF